MHMASSLKLPQFGQAVDFGTQSITHSVRLPGPSNTPRAETQPLREPVAATANALNVLQSVVPLSEVPASGVPFAPTCHSPLVGSRLPALAHASCDWNHVM